MDSSFDSVEGLPFQPTGKVNQLQHSERDKRRKNARTLKDKEEEDKEKRRRQSAKDEVVLSAIEDEEESKQQEDDENSSDSDKGEESVDQTDDMPETPSSRHIDVKA